MHVARFLFPRTCGVWTLCFAAETVAGVDSPTNEQHVSMIRVPVCAGLPAAAAAAALNAVDAGHPRILCCLRTRGLPAPSTKVS